MEQYPKKFLMQIGGITCFFLLYSLVRGGRKFESLIGLEPCGFLYHLSNIGVLILSYYAVKSIIQELGKSFKEDTSITEVLTTGDQEM